MRFSQYLLIMDSFRSRWLGPEGPGQHMDLGGLKPDGHDASNELSNMFIEAMMHTPGMVEPTLGLLVHSKTPEDLLIKACQLTALGGGYPQFINQGTHFRYRLFMKYHAFTKYDQFRSILFDNLQASYHIDFIGIFNQYREIDHSRFFRFLISCHKVPQSSHGLSTEMPPFNDMVIQYAPDTTLFAFSVGPIQKIHHGAEYGHICHLTGY